MEEKNIGEKLFFNSLERKFERTKILDRTKQKKIKMLLETVSEREREKHTKVGTGREIEKINRMLGPPCGDGVICAHA